MPENWTIRYRSVEECSSTLRHVEEQTLQRKAERMSQFPAVELGINYPGLPNLTGRLINEALMCFVDGHYNGSVAVLGTAVEHGLRKKLAKGVDVGMEVLLQEGARILSSEQFATLRNLQAYRNKTIHADLAPLAIGLELEETPMMLTQQGVRDQGATRVFVPADDTEIEIAVELNAEPKVLALLQDVRMLLYELFDEKPDKARGHDGNTED